MFNLIMLNFIATLSKTNDEIVIGGLLRNCSYSYNY